MSLSNLATAALCVTPWEQKLINALKAIRKASIIFILWTGSQKGDHLHVKNMYTNLVSRNLNLSLFTHHTFASNNNKCITFQWKNCTAINYWGKHLNAKKLDPGITFVRLSSILTPSNACNSIIIQQTV